MITSRVAVILMLTALSSLSAQTPRPRSERILKLQKQPTRPVDTIVVHDTVTMTLVRVDTVRLPALSFFDTVFRRQVIYDTVRDTVRRRGIVPIPVPIPLSHEHTVAAAECLPAVVAPAPNPDTTSPEPASLVLMATALLAAIGIARRRRRKSMHDEQQR